MQWLAIPYVNYLLSEDMFMHYNACILFQI